MYKRPRVFVNTLGRLQTPCYGQKPYDNKIDFEMSNRFIIEISQADITCKNCMPHIVKVRAFTFKV